MLQKLIPFIAGIAVLALLIFGVSYVMDRNAQVPADITYVLEPIHDGSYRGEVPSLSYETNFGATIPENVRAVLRGKIEKLIDSLKSHPYDGNAWMELALNYHTGNDFKAAERVWLFVVDVTPTNVTALGNLGRLYHFEYKDFPKAEEYFKKAIAANAERKEAYFDLFDLYRYSYKKDTTAAVDIMKEGMGRFPDDINFPAGLGTYYRDLGQKAKARQYFEQALTMARKMEDVGLIQNFTTELSRL